MYEYDAIVIGAGNGGLSTACGLARGGMKTLLLEQHNVPGGYATTFRRGDYEFEGSLHHLSGFGTADHPGPLRKIFDEIGVTDKMDYLELPNVIRFIAIGKCDFVIPTGRVNVIAALKKVFPEESNAIDDYFDMAWKCWSEFEAMFQSDFNLIDIYSKFDNEASPEKYPTFFKYAFQKATSVLSSFFKNPILMLAVSAVGSYSGPVTDVDFLDILVWQYYYFEYMPLHIKGGSQAQSTALVNKFLEDGGEVRYNSPVKKILVDNGAVSGAVTENGDVFHAKRIISNVSPLVTFGEFIEKEHVPAKAFEDYKGTALGRGTAVVYIALDCPCEQIGIKDTNIWIFDLEKSDFLTITTRDPVDPRSDGKSLIDIVSFSPSEEWLTTPPDQYFKKKYDLAESIIEKAEISFPGIREHIEEMEVSTPLTNVRYTGAPAGAIGGLKTYFRRYLLFPENHHNVIDGLYFAATGCDAPGGYQPMLSYGWSLGCDIAKKFNS